MAIDSRNGFSGKESNKHGRGSSKEKDHNMEKSAVLQETKLFNQPKLSPTAARQTLTKLLMLNLPLNPQEQTLVFFSLTKLFQIQDTSLRQMLYLSLNSLLEASDIIMATSSITKDIMTAQIFKPNAIRTLVKITHPSLFSSLERFLIQAFVDQVSSTSSAALVSCTLAYPASKEFIKRSTVEINQALSTKSPITHSHALRLLFLAKQDDRIAISKLIELHSGRSSPVSSRVIINEIKKLYTRDPQPALDSILLRYLTKSTPMVTYEAARTILSLSVAPEITIAAISSLQTMMLHSNQAMRFAALRTLNAVSQTHPEWLNCNTELESLVQDKNTSISTLAITTILTTCTQLSLARVIKMVMGVVKSMPPRFQKIVVHSIGGLCLKFPEDIGLLVEALSAFIQTETSANADIVETLLKLVSAKSPSNQNDTILDTLAEYIEDCDDHQLTMRILANLGKFGPRSKTPGRYVRCIYNRIVIEPGSVRAAAVSALFEFRDKVGGIDELLKLSLRYLEDDEVRERAAFYLACDMTTSHDFVAYVDTADIVARPINGRSSPVHSLLEPEYTAGPQWTIPELLSCGDILKSGVLTALTEPEVEYTVSLQKHLTATHVIFEFVCNNTIEGVVLENAWVKLSIVEGGCVPGVIVPTTLVFSEPQSTYVVVEHFGSLATFTTSLQFNAVEGDSRYDDTYDVEDSGVYVSDYLVPHLCQTPREQMIESRQAYNLTGDLATCVSGLYDSLGVRGLLPNKGEVGVQGELQALWIDAEVYISYRMVTEDGGVLLEVRASALAEHVSRLVADCIQ